MLNGLRFSRWALMACAIFVLGGVTFHVVFKSCVGEVCDDVPVAHYRSKGERIKPVLGMDFNRTPSNEGFVGRRSGADVHRDSSPQYECAFILKEKSSGLELQRYLIAASDDKGARHDVVTDEFGHASFWRRGQEGDELELRFKFVDQESLVGKRPPDKKIVFVLGSRERVQIEIESGPRFDVVFDDQSLVDASVEMHASIMPTNRVWQIVQEQEDHSSDFPLTDSPVMDVGKQAWVRFGQLDKSYRDGSTGSLSLVIADREGAILAYSGLRPLESYDMGLVLLHVVSLGTLLGSVDCAQVDLPKGVWVRLTGSAERPLRPVTQWVEGGEFSFLNLKVGEYELLCSGPGFDPFGTVVSVERGQGQISIQLIASDSAGPVVGKVLSSSGEYNEEIFAVLLPSPRNGRPGYRVPVHWGVVGRSVVGEFVFDNVGDAKYEFSLEMNGFIEWSGSTGNLSLPGEDISVFIHDGKVLDVLIEVFDSNSGEPLEGEMAIVLIRNGMQASVVHGGPSIAVRNISLDGELEWFVMCNGYLPFRGEGDDLFGQATSEGKALTYRANVEPGWGLHFVFVDENGLRVPDVEVVADTLAFLANSSGELDIALIEKPEDLKIQKAGWKLGPAGKKVMKSLVWPSYTVVQLERVSSEW